MNMASYDYDLIVIGSGPSGAIAAQQASKAGKRVAIVESGSFGGSEVHAGIFPLSALLHSANVYETAKHGSRFGVRGATIGYNYPTIKNWKDLVVKRTGIHGGEDAYNAMGINVVRGRAYFIDERTITIGAARFTASEFLIATGTEATLPTITGLSSSGFLTISDALQMQRPPKRLAVLGGGQYSYEITQFFAALGSKVYIIEPSAAIASDEEPEVSQHLTNVFEERYSVSVLTSTTVEKVTGGLNRKLHLLQNGSKTEITVDEIILATQQKAVTDIGLENAGVAYSEKGIHVSSELRTSVRHIFAAGGCTDLLGSGDSAAYQGQIAAHNILHPKRTISTQEGTVPRVLFTTPEVASVGMTEKELQARGFATQSAITPISVIPKANITDFSDGFVKVIAEKKSGAILGATVVCPNASEVIQELTLAITASLTVHDLIHTVHVSPSWSEAVRVTCLKLARS